MRILSYSPSVEAYIAASGKDGSVEYYDVSRDIVECSVTRKQNECSTFTLKLQNKNGKYNNKFLPMDRITIYATKKTQRNQLLTGYITSVTRYSLTPGDFVISGSCSLYKLQQTYWDKQLPASVALMTEGENSDDDGWTDYSSLIYKLVHIVGGMPANMAIGVVPDETMEWARKLYEAKRTDIAGLNDALSQFNDVLGKVGQFSSSRTAPVGTIEGAVQWMINLASDESVGYSQSYRALNPDVDCSSFVYYGLIKGAGFTTEELGGSPFATSTMDEKLLPNGFVKVAWDGNAESLSRGDIMWKKGHTEMYIGDGKCVGAHSSENGGITGKGGDQTGNEVSISGLSKSFTHYYRYTRNDKSMNAAQRAVEIGIQAVR